MVFRGGQWKYVVVKFKTSKKTDEHFEYLTLLPYRTRQNRGFVDLVNTQSVVKAIEYFHCTCRITINNIFVVISRS